MRIDLYLFQNARMRKKMQWVLKSERKSNELLRIKYCGLNGNVLRYCFAQTDGGAKRHIGPNMQLWMVFSIDKEDAE